MAKRQTLEQAVASGSAKPMSSGFGESRVFAAPEGTFVRQGDVNPEIPPVEEWTVNGEPIPAAFAHAVPFANTDQGRKMIEDGMLLVDHRPRVQVTASAEEKADMARARGEDPGTTASRRPKIEGFDRAIQQRIDAGEDGDETMPWECADPQRDIVEKHVPPGFAARFLSDRIVDKLGLRGWKPVIGKDGRPVKMASQTLAIMPAEKAKQRSEHYRKQAAAAEQHSVDQFTEGQDRLVHEAEKRGMEFRPLRPKEAVVGERGRADIGTQSYRNNSEPEILMEA